MFTSACVCTDWEHLPSAFYRSPAHGFWAHRLDIPFDLHRNHTMITTDMCKEHLRTKQRMIITDTFFPGHAKLRGRV